MVLTILKKDLRLLWPGLAAVTLLQAGLAAFEYVKGPFGDTRSTLEFAKLAESERLLEGLVLAGIALLVALTVHQDALPQIDLDWLVRPIRRPQLAAAKMMFFLGGIQLPMLILDVVHSLASGFALGPALLSALSRGLFFLVGVILPLFVLAAMTRNVVEFIVGIAIAVGAVEVMDRLFQYGLGVTPLQSVFHDSLEEFGWIVVALKYLTIAGASLAVLSLQYARRKTSTSRLIFAPLLLLGFAACYLPWQFMSEIQEAVSGPSSFQIEVDPAGPGVVGDYLDFPLKISGLPAGYRLVPDWEESSPFEGYVEIDGDGPWLDSRGRNGQAHFGVQHADRSTGPIVLDMAVTIVEKLGDDVDLPVSEAYRPVPALGRCRVRDPGRQVKYVPLVAECAQAGQIADLSTMAAYAPGHADPYAIGMTRFSYSPVLAQLLPDAIARVSVSMVPSSTEQPNATADFYPGSHILVRNYRLVGHRKVHLVLALKG